MKTVANHARPSQVVHVCDREGDIFELYHELSLTSHQFLIWAFGDHVVGERFAGRPSITKKNTKLWAFMEAKEPAGTLKVKVPTKQNQSKREACCEIRYSEVLLSPPYYYPRTQNLKLCPLKLFAIWIKEINSPLDTEPLDWMLMTNIEINSIDDAIEKITWYKKRWHIENFHKVLKSGCSIEKSKLNHGEKLEKIVTVMSIIAARIYELKLIGRSDPDKPCTEILDSEEWNILYFVTKKTFNLPKNPPTCREVIWWIAKLGGFLGRKNDGEPGSVVIWRGWEKLTSFIENWKTFQLIATSG